MEGLLGEGTTTRKRKRGHLRVVQPGFDTTRMKLASRSPSATRLSFSRPMDESGRLSALRPYLAAGLPFSVQS